MKSARNLFAIVVVTCLPASASANGLVYELPADGTKSVYAMTMEIKQAKLTVEGTISISSVGKAKSGGKDCRWIEFSMHLSAMGQEQKIVTKILVPEEDLGKGKNPFKNPQKGWVMKQNGEAMEIGDFTGRKAGPLPAFLAGPLKGAMKLAEKEIDTGIGKLKCKGVSGMHTYQQAGKDTEIAYTSRLSSKAPFGVAHCVMTVKEESNGVLTERATLTFNLKSVSKNAKSALPDKN